MGIKRFLLLLLVACNNLVAQSYELPKDEMGLCDTVWYYEEYSEDSGATLYARIVFDEGGALFRYWSSVRTFIEPYKMIYSSKASTKTVWLYSSLVNFALNKPMYRGEFVWDNELKETIMLLYMEMLVSINGRDMSLIGILRKL